MIAGIILLNSGTLAGKVVGYAGLLIGLQLPVHLISLRRERKDPYYRVVPNPAAGSRGLILIGCISALAIWASAGESSMPVGGRLGCIMIAIYLSVLLGQYTYDSIRAAEKIGWRGQTFTTGITLFWGLVFYLLAYATRGHEDVIRAGHLLLHFFIGPDPLLSFLSMVFKLRWYWFWAFLLTQFLWRHCVEYFIKEPIPE